MTPDEKIAALERRIAALEETNKVFTRAIVELDLRTVLGGTALLSKIWDDLEHERGLCDDDD